MRILTLLFFTLCISISLVGQSPKGKLLITHLTSDYYVYVTYNNYQGNLVSANGMYLVTDIGVILIDTPWDTTQFQPLLDSIKIKHHKSVVMCIATHSHKDRTGGLEFLKQRGVKTYTSRMTDEICKAKNEKRAEFTFKSDTLFTVGKYSFQAFYGGPGHTADNIVVWFPQGKILYGGCLVKSVEATNLGYIDEANLKEWPKTITNIKQKFGKPNFIIPGHDSWSDTRSLERTLELLKKKQP